MHDNVPSNTAGIVARNIAVVAAMEKTAHLINPETARLNAELINGFSGDSSRFFEMAGKTWFQTFFRIYERLTIRGLALHQALRKLQIERCIRAAMDENFQQVIVLGGGLDTLALRLHREFPEINFLEIDHPATQKLKRETIEKQCLSGENLNFLAVDLTRETLEETLRTCPNFVRNTKTVYVCEGVLMYLEDAEVILLFESIRRQSSSAQRFVFTFMETNVHGETDFRQSTFLVRLWLKWKQEPFKWGLAADELQDYLSDRGFRLNALTTSEGLRHNYLHENRLADEFIAEGENICVCETLT